MIEASVENVASRSTEVVEVFPEFCRSLRIFPSGSLNISVSSTMWRTMVDCVRADCCDGSEGIVCKRKDSPYKAREKPSRYWFKIKNSRYSQLDVRNCSSACSRSTIHFRCRRSKPHAITLWKRASCGG